MSRSGKTGSNNRPWVELEKPKPPRVRDSFYYQTTEPPTRSERCDYWVRQLNAGWLPNRHIHLGGYSGKAEWYGVWIWEYLNVLAPLERANNKGTS